MWPIIMGLILLFIAVALGLAINHDPGYLLVSFHNISIETSLWVGVAAILIVFIIMYATLRIIDHTRRIPERWTAWGEERRHNKSHSLTSEGLCYLAEGKWRGAEKLLAKSAHKNDNTLINFLGAARAAQAQQAYSRRDRYLRIAYKKHKKARLAISLTQAQLQIASKQWQEAKVTLENIHEHFPQSQFSLQLLAKTYQHLQAWEALHQLLPEIHKRSQMTEQETQELDEQTYLALLAKASNDSEKSLLACWHKIPKATRLNPEILRAYSQYLIKFNKDDVAADLLEVFLKKHWDSRLVHIYGECHGKKNKKRLDAAEGWLKKHPHDPDLLVSLGHLSQQQKLWGKAEDYYKQAIKIAPNPRTYRDLATVYETIDEPKKAMQCYRDALQIDAAPITSNLPPKHTNKQHATRDHVTPIKKTKRNFWRLW